MSNQNSGGGEFILSPLQQKHVHPPYQFSIVFRNLWIFLNFPSIELAEIMPADFAQAMKVAEIAEPKNWFSCIAANEMWKTLPPPPVKPPGLAQSGFLCSAEGRVYK